MLDPFVTCHRCGKIVNTKNGKIKAHKIKNTDITCIGSGEEPRR